MGDFTDFTDADTWDANVGEVTPPSTFETPGTTVDDSNPGQFTPPGEGAGPGGPAGTGFDEPGGAGTNVAPTAADVQNLKDKGYSDADIAKILGKVAENHPEWKNVVTALVPKGFTLPTGTTPGNTTPGGSPLGTTDPMGLLAAAGLAYQQFHNADQYTKQADKYGKELNPYGVYRDAAAQKLAALQADPSSIQDTPGYKFALQQGLGAVANRDNRSFGVGAGSTNPDMMNYAQGLASKTYNDTIKQYSDQAGVGIGPSAAASIYGLGMQGNIASQNNAVNALMSPFGPGNNTGGNSGGGGIDWSKIASFFGGNTLPPEATYPTGNQPGDTTSTKPITNPDEVPTGMDPLHE